VHKVGILVHSLLSDLWITKFFRGMRPSDLRKRKEAGVEEIFFSLTFIHSLKDAVGRGEGCICSHKGDQFDRDTYLRSNIAGQNTWHAQTLERPRITIFDATAVLTCIVTDDVSTVAGRKQNRMPMTQVWIHEDERWLLVAGHAGPLL
jgi:hypothetical protein